MIGVPGKKRKKHDGTKRVVSVKARTEMTVRISNDHHAEKEWSRTLADHLKKNASIYRVD